MTAQDAHARVAGPGVATKDLGKDLVVEDSAVTINGQASPCRQVGDLSLPELAGRANATHQEAYDASRTAYDRWVECGRVLIAARTKPDRVLGLAKPENGCRSYPPAKLKWCERCSRKLGVEIDD